MQLMPLVTGGQSGTDRGSRQYPARVAAAIDRTCHLMANSTPNDPADKDCCVVVMMVSSIALMTTALRLMLQPRSMADALRCAFGHDAIFRLNMDDTGKIAEHMFSVMTVAGNGHRGRTGAQQHRDASERERVEQAGFHER
jgi:hypothetical protein